MRIAKIYRFRPENAEVATVPGEGESIAAAYW
jgi:hypothetical protein